MKTTAEDVRTYPPCNTIIDEDKVKTTQIDEPLGGDYELVSQITKIIIGIP